MLRVAIVLFALIIGGCSWDWSPSHWMDPSRDDGGGDGEPEADVGPDGDAVVDGDADGNGEADTDGDGGVGEDADGDGDADVPDVGDADAGPPALVYGEMTASGAPIAADGCVATGTGMCLRSDTVDSSSQELTGGAYRLRGIVGGGGLP